MTQEDSRKIRLIMALRQKGITDTNVLSAIERIPRENFIHPSMADQAYDDIALPIGLGQTISQPLVVASMTQALKLEKNHKILEIGTGSGYQASVLAQLVRRVYTVERHKPLLEIAEKHFDTLKIRNITALAADGMKGWPTQAPFDRILLTAAAMQEIPKALLDQLKIGGLIVAPIEIRSAEQMLRIIRKESDDVYATTDLFPVRFVPLLPDIERMSSYREDELEALPA